MAIYANLKRVVGALLVSSWVASAYPSASSYWVSSAASSCSVMQGVMVSGAEFGCYSSTCDPWANSYTWDLTGAGKWYTDRGMKLLRIPFRWERMQQGFGSSLNTTELTYLKSVVTTFLGYGATVIIDVHNYGRYSGSICGQAAGCTTTNYYDFLKALVNQDTWVNNANVWFGIMQEPFNQSATTWHSTANSALANIRSIPASNKVIISAARYDRSYNWYKSGDGWGVANSALTINDTNFAVEAHMYYDTDYSGSNWDCINATVGSVGLGSFTSWLRTKGYMGIVTETGGSYYNTCLKALDNTMTYIESNSDVYLGYTLAATGPWRHLDTDPTCLYAENGITPIQYSNVISKHVCSTSPTVSPSPPTMAPTPAPVSSSCSAQYAQCGGIGWAGPFCCNSPYTCTYGNDYYYQCL